MPGTPVIYYGDEIGMGDNIFLGDRDGVRTPMQWSMDRNGGFSRADPAKLVLPPIMDPIYGYQAVNVEAQASDPHSLLNWTRRMLAVRKRHRAFGRGVQRFLYPGNRKVLAFLREWQADDGATETILCVSNLSRTAQAVELDLSAYAGRVPVDIIGGSVFPPIGQLTYLLTLPPYGFFWFLLAEGAQLPSWHSAPPEPLPDYATIVIRAGAARRRAGRRRPAGAGARGAAGLPAEAPLVRVQGREAAAASASPTPCRCPATQGKRAVRRDRGRSCRAAPRTTCCRLAWPGKTRPSARWRSNWR